MQHGLQAGGKRAGIVQQFGLRKLEACMQGTEGKQRGSAPPMEEGAREPWWLPPSGWPALLGAGAEMPSKGGSGEVRGRGGPRRPRCRGMHMHSACLYTQQSMHASLPGSICYVRRRPIVLFGCQPAKCDRKRTGKQPANLWHCTVRLKRVRGILH